MRLRAFTVTGARDDVRTFEGGDALPRPTRGLLTTVVAKAMTTPGADSLMRSPRHRGNGLIRLKLKPHQ
ncbi:hypothetical protein EVAR_12298_1 [Eumeta japonica]|uniref:Uncharacterized protein n=1 Tax=Eumeta variegata TaxID=151549 RepID=A0A4C1TUA2_EUMVA|nr:hypothetical protein EVAR_12298_1 [Eumeta japonica]